MPALKAVLVLGIGLLGCRKHVTDKQCDEIIARYAELVVRDELPDASPELVAAERTRELEEARMDEGFKRCATELEPVDYTCAMHAPTADALEACLK